jgi:glycosyltransferase involved in cell wall biosynthesis
VKILIANKFFFRNGGSEAVMFQERDFLAGTGHEVIDFSMTDERNEPSRYAGSFAGRRQYRSGATLGKIRSALALMHSSEAAFRMGQLIDATRPDIVHCHNIYHQLTPSIIGAARSRGVPVVLTLHDYKPVCPAYLRLRDGKPCSDCLNGDFRPVMKHRCADGSLGKSALLYGEAVIQRRLGNYEKVSRFVAPSRFMRDSIVHRFPPERVNLLYNGVDLGSISASDQDDGYALYLGRLSSEKGIETLLRTHAEADGRWPLMVAGTGPMGEAFRTTYPTARFAGHLAGEALRSAIARAGAVVVPSECLENCPMAVLEAMAYGKPVVGSRMGGIPELIADGETGLLFDAGSVGSLAAALSRLMQAPDLRREMGRNARLRAERHFSLAAHNRGLLDIYESVLTTHEA